MKSTSDPDPDRVLADLGESFVRGCADAVADTRTDFSTYRSQHPDWSAESSERGTASWIHDRLWANLRARLVDEAAVTFVDAGPLRQIMVTRERLYVIRAKRHDQRDAICNYPTLGSTQFWKQSEFPILEEVHLSVGYRWDPEIREIGEAIVSFRRKASAAIWTKTLLRGTGGAAITPLGSAPAPSLPGIDLSSLSRAGDGDERARQE